MVLGRSATASDGTAPYRRRRPERTLLYRTVQTHFETWRALSGDRPEAPSPPAHVEREFRRYLELDASVRIEADDCAGRERLLRYDRRKSPGGI